MKYWYFIFSLSLLNYILANSDDENNYTENDGEKKIVEAKLGADYSSGDQDRNPSLLLGDAETENDGEKKKLHAKFLAADYSSGDMDRYFHPSLLSGDSGTENRSLMAGDTFTPQDMLPIAVKLLKKVEEPGSGKGFVSSTKGPHELADRLYEAFFMSTKRIVTLKDFDISGLDALQALAISGDVAEKNITEDVTEPAQRMYLRNQIVNINKPRRSHYKLVTKTVPKKVSKKHLRKGKRRGIPLAKKLPPKRHLVVNEKEKQETNKTQKINNKEHKKITRKGMKINKKIKMNTTKGSARSKPGRKSPKCRWNYVCINPNDLDTCRVHTSCGNVSPMTDKNTEKEIQNINEFRRMVGITAVDEEVEKIMEARNARIRPANLDAINRVESLSEFFNNIIERENSGTTPPVTPD